MIRPQPDTRAVVAPASLDRVTTPERATVGVRWFGLGAFLGLAACNAVLGIETAEYVASTGGSASQATGGASGSTSAASGGGTFTPIATSRCTTCVADHCPDYMAECLKDNTCRYQLADFGNCVAKDQTDPTCVEKLNTKLGSCVSGSCSTECPGSALVSTCDLYCSCMAAQCATPAATDCAGTCGKLSPATAACRFTHCQVALGTNAEKHCKHARADAGFDVCVDADRAAPCTAGQNPTGAPKGGGCNQSSDCCFGDCDTLNGFCR